ncbi:uncharacterized protein LY89DRAFT_129454 [Mollisia scopiformis]|uniref:Uncharacterized protein n=1 Tax=Mollisia scopiformis TaxID=149040 RepID=A0A194X4I8_MOLSC|nr:uncharacterized protein LY89DRAFT_129454 [Mollisia scopiformis]KUJ15095.1 hypothetical protein LY89DRAFT_129454 [Mollisia scopiformis]
MGTSDPFIHHLDLCSKLKPKKQDDALSSHSLTYSPPFHPHHHSFAQKRAPDNSLRLHARNTFPTQTGLESHALLPHRTLVGVAVAFSVAALAHKSPALARLEQPRAMQPMQRAAATTTFGLVPTEPITTRSSRCFVRKARLLFRPREEEREEAFGGNTTVYPVIPV